MWARAPVTCHCGLWLQLSGCSPLSAQLATAAAADTGAAMVVQETLATSPAWDSLQRVGTLWLFWPDQSPVERFVQAGPEICRISLFWLHREQHLKTPPIMACILPPLSSCTISASRQTGSLAPTHHVPAPFSLQIVPLWVCGI